MMPIPRISEPTLFDEKRNLKLKVEEIFECEMERGYRISIPGKWAILALARTSIASISGFVRDLL
jgi:hypothetical protein